MSLMTYCTRRSEESYFTMCYAVSCGWRTRHDSKCRIIVIDQLIAMETSTAVLFVHSTYTHLKTVGASRTGRTSGHLAAVSATSAGHCVQVSIPTSSGRRWRMDGGRLGLVEGNVTPRVVDCGLWWSHIDPILACCRSYSSTLWGFTPVLLLLL